MTDTVTTIASAEDKAQSAGQEDDQDSSRRQPHDQDALHKIDSYMRAKLTLVIVDIVKEFYKDIRSVNLVGSVGFLRGLRFPPTYCTSRPILSIELIMSLVDAQLSILKKIMISWG
jgi:hypothetical protein